MIRVVVADDNREFCQILSEAVCAAEDMTCVHCVNDGLAAVDAVRSLSPDVLILDHVMPNLDGIGVLEALRSVNPRPKVLMFTAFGHESLIRRASELGADYFIMKPFDIPTLIDRIRLVADPHGAILSFQQEQRRQMVEREVTRLLSGLGVPPHFKGYGYLKDAVTLVVLEPDLLGAVTTRLYPVAARLRGTTSHKVERAIRHAIESTWVRGNLEQIELLFTHSVDAEKGKPTNSTFIARLADQVRMDMLAS